MYVFSLGDDCILIVLLSGLTVFASISIRFEFILMELSIRRPKALIGLRITSDNFLTREADRKLLGLESN
jgi:hypothetical protein